MVQAMENNDTELILKNSAVKITQNELSNFEVSYNLRLPNDYKEFLIKHNGGSPNKIFFRKNNADLVVDIFLSLSKEEYSIEKYYANMVIEDKELPEKILPIGIDAFGNIICISCRDEDFGKVYFWDHEEDWDHEDPNDIELRLLADNLSFILDNLVKDFE
jgi:hypothetical protein